MDGTSTWPTVVAGGSSTSPSWDWNELLVAGRLGTLLGPEGSDVSSTFQTIRPGSGVREGCPVGWGGGADHRFAP